MQHADDCQRLDIGIIDNQKIGANREESNRPLCEFLLKCPSSGTIRNLLTRCENVRFQLICRAGVVGRNETPNLKNIVRRGRGEPVISFPRLLLPGCLA